MAKSSLSGSRLQYSTNDAIAELPTWQFELVINNITTSVDLHRLTYYLCEKSPAKIDRKNLIARYAKRFKQEFDRNVAHATLYNSFGKFKQYLIWCDKNSQYPSSEKAFRQYHSYLWELVLIGNSSMMIWQMSEGQTIGLKERTAKYVFSTIEQALTWCGENAFQWGKQLRQFRVSKVAPYEAYSENELPVILNRISSYFFQLAIPLLSDAYVDEISININQVSFNIATENKNTKGRSQEGIINVDIAFNQAMACGYYLLSYFTAFNTSQLTDLCHPIEWKEDKTGEYYKLSAFKKRANKEVLSLIGGEIHKKSLQFIETLIALSLKYSGETNSKLLYWLDKSGNQRSLSSTYLSHAQLNTRLCLVSDKAPMCISYLMNIHTHFIETSKKGYIEFDELKFINRTLTKKRKKICRFYNRRVITLSFTLLLAMITANPKNRLNNINIKNILLPLKIDSEGQNLKVDFYYKDGGCGTFYIDAEYGSFLSRVEEYAIVRQSKRASNTNYLFPLGSERNSIQWEGLAPSMKYLADYGIQSGQFWVNLISSRFRETAAKLARRKANSTELLVSHILNNQYQTVLKHYSEGNHYDNQLIISQGLLVVEKMSSGNSLEQSKIEVAIELAIPVIKFDELIGSDANLNGVGVACFQKSATDTTNENNSVCFDYESCIKCQFAKLINDVEPIYRLLSFLECMEESWLYYPERFSKNLGKAIELYKKIISRTLSPKVIQQAQLRLDTEGRHFLWDNLELASLGFKGI